MPEIVLLVEDEALIALNEARMLEKHGYAVRTVHTGEAAVETAVQEQAVSLVLMDIDLGEGMDGTDAARAIMERRELPVVFLTCHTEEEYVNRVEAITSYGIVQKSSGEFFIIQAIKMAYRLFRAHRQTQLHERKYRLIAENAGEMITTTDEHFQPTYVSPAVESILGYTQEEYLQKSSEELLTPDSFARAVQAYRSRKPGDTSFQQLELEMIRKDGSTVWCESFTKPLFDERGYREGTIVTTRDISGRKRAEEDLRQSRERLRAVADFTYDWEDWIGTDGGLVWVNPAVERITGYSPAECYRMPDYPKPLAHEEDWPKVREELRQGFEEGAVMDQREFRCICKDGSVKWISVSLQPIYDEQGKSLGIRTSARDITGSKQTRESLRSIVEHSPVGFFYLDRDFRITYENPAARRIVGVPEDEDESAAIGCDIREMSSVGEMMKPAEIERIASGEDQIEFETYFESIYGKKRYLWIIAVPMRNKHAFDGAILMMEDMTDRREYERINEERTLYMEAILTSTPNAILTLDTENQIKEWNPGAERLFGYAKEEAIGRDLDELVGGKDPSTYDEALGLTRQVSGGRPVPPTETVRYTKDGEALNVIVAGSPIMVEGTFTGIVATYTNITRLKGKEAEVKQLLHEKEQLLHEVHHRIKNHMGTILSILSLHSSSSEDPAIFNALEEVQNKIRIMQNIYQTLYTGEYVDSVHVSAFLDALIEDIESTYLYRESVQLETQIEDVNVTAKQSLPIGIIVNELVTNSIKYAFAEHESGRIRVALEQLDDRLLRITVEDNGSGMPDEIVQDGNYGFGLTLVQSYAYQFGGEMEVDNREGNRVTVTLRLE